MNLIMVLIDSLNLRCLGPYGEKTIQTPNLDKFARKAAVFDNHFIGSAPCMPARRELMTGRKEFFWRGWGPMEPFDSHIALEAKKAGAVTAIVTDHYHYWEYFSHGYLERFDGITMIRGHEIDMLNTEPCSALPRWIKAIEKFRPGLGIRYYNNVKDFQGEEDFFAPRTMAAAADWLDKNHMHDKFFLWTECFDTHEPFHVPEPYRSMYTDKLSEDYNCWPPYQAGMHGHNADFWNSVTDDELAFIRGQYYGKVTMTDKWLGKLLDKMDKYNLWENTAVIVTTDHGHELGEKRRFAKEPPHYDLSAHIPLMIWHPCINDPFRVPAFTTAVDIYPTILEILGAKDIQSPHGLSLMPLVRRETDTHREVVVYGSYGAGVTVSNSRYTYHSSWDINSVINAYTAIMLKPQPNAVGGKFIPGVNCPVWKYPMVSEPPLPEMLFDRKDDPDQDNDISSVNRAGVHEMRDILKNLMDEEGVPPEQYIRLWFK